MRLNHERQQWQREKRLHDEERKTWTEERNRLYALIELREAHFRQERREWAQERRELLTRVQAPKEAAVMYAPAPEGIPDRPFIPLDDDEAYAELVKQSA